MYIAGVISENSGSSPAAGSATVNTSLKQTSLERFFSRGDKRPSNGSNTFLFYFLFHFSTIEQLTHSLILSSVHSSPRRAPLFPSSERNGLLIELSLRYFVCPYLGLQWVYLPRSVLCLVALFQKLLPVVLITITVLAVKRINICWSIHSFLKA